MKHVESAHQQALIGWSRTIPILAALLYAIPNGGARSQREGGTLKAEGVRAGMPDLCLPLARGGFHALYIEMKRPKGGRLSPAQVAVHEALRSAGNQVQVCAGYEPARAALAAYLALD